MQLGLREIAVLSTMFAAALGLQAQAPDVSAAEPRARQAEVERIANHVDHEVASGRTEDLGGDIARLTAFLSEPLAPSARFQALLALANWHRDRVNAVGERTLDRMLACRRGLDEALASASSAAERTEAYELRGYAGSFLGEFERARQDLAAARAGREALGDRVGAARCLRRFAYLAFREGQPERICELLDRRTEEVASYLGAAPPLDNTDEYLRIVALIELGRIDDAAVAANRHGIAERALLREAPYPTILWSYRRSQFNLAVLAGCAVGRAREHPADESKIFALLAGFMEGARVRALRAALGGFESRPEGFTLAELRPLPERIILLRYLMASDPTGERRRLVLLASRGSEQRVVDLGDADSIDARVEEFAAQHLGKNALGETANSYATAAERLARSVLGPVVEWIRDASSARLLIVADGTLARLPFQALVVTPAGDGARDCADLDYLVRHAAVLHLPSFGVLDALAEPSQDESCLALLAPDTGSEQPLRFAALEEQAIRMAHPDTRILRGSGASKAALLAQLSADPPGWLHLACHARSDPESAQRALLELARADELTVDQSGLRVSDVATLPLARGTRVILSACGTANGDYVRGEGVLGLWRAFLAAGASCVVSTLKEVDDRSAAAWCGQLHLAAARGAPLADAARIADLAWLEGSGQPRFPRGASIPDPAHPALWAAYVCVGDDGGALPGRKR